VGFLAFMVVHFRVTLPLARIAKLLAACTVMFFAVRLVGWPLASLPALIVGIPLGAAIFVLLMRWLRCLDPTDGDRLRQLDRLLPARLRGPYVAVVDFLAPAQTG
jgi:hypothetical protein